MCTFFMSGHVVPLAGRSRHGGGELAHPNSELLTAGLRMTMFKDATVSESLSTFLQVWVGGWSGSWGRLSVGRGRHA